MSHAGREGRGSVILTRYSKTNVSDLSVWTMSCSVTMLACFRSFSNDTAGEESGGLFKATSPHVSDLNKGAE